MCNDAVSSCCFGAASLRVGVIATAIYSMIVSAFAMGLQIFNYSYTDSNHHTSLLSAIVYGVWLLFSAGLFLGVRKENRGFLMAWLVYTWILTVLLFIAIIIVGISLPALSTSSRAYAVVIVAFVVYILVAIANIYCCMVVHSHYASLVPPVTTFMTVTNPGSSQVVQVTSTQNYMQFQNPNDTHHVPMQYATGYAGGALPNPAAQQPAAQQLGYGVPPPQYREKQDV